MAAVLGLVEGAGHDTVADAQRLLVNGGRPDAVVEEVHGEDVAHAHVVVLVELSEHLRYGAGPVGAAAKEGVHLDAEHGSHLAAVDDLPRVLAGGDDAEPSRTGSATLVDR